MHRGCRRPTGTCRSALRMNHSDQSASTTLCSRISHGEAATFGAVETIVRYLPDMLLRPRR